MSAVQAAAGNLVRTRTGRKVLPPLAVTAPLALFTVALVLVSRHLAVQDSWLTLVAGREVAEHGLPHVDHLTRMAAGRHWVDQQWLAQLMLFGTARLAGVGAAFAVCLVATVTAFALALHVAYRHGASPVSLLLFLPLAAIAAPWGLQLRAQSLALPLFALTLWLLAGDPRAERRSTLLVLPVLVVWANVHGSVLVGVALVLAWALSALAAGGGWKAAACLLLAPAAVFASPYAVELPRYYRTMLLDPPFGRYVTEWQRTTPSAASAVFFALAAVGLALVIVRRRRLVAFDALALTLAFAVGLDALRGIVWFALVALAVLPALATRAPWAARFDGVLESVLSACALGGIALALGTAATRPAQAYETAFPAALAGVVRTHVHAGANVYADDASADWLLWRFPQLRNRVAYDVRFEVMTPVQIQRLRAWRNFLPGWERVADGYSLVVDDPAHVDRLVATGRWHRVRLDPASQTVAVAERGPLER